MSVIGQAREHDMNIGGVLGKYGVAGLQGGALAGRGGQKEAVSWPIISHEDKVTISQEARAALSQANSEAEDANGEAEKSPAIPLVKTFLNSVYGDTKDREKEKEDLEEWTEKQLMERDKPGQPFEESQAKKDFRKYMDKILGRGVISGPKSVKERIKELTDKIKTLQTRLSEVVADQSLPEAAKTNQVQTITSQINGLYTQIAEIAKTAAEQASASEEES